MNDCDISHVFQTKGYDEFAEEILQYAKSKPAFPWGTVKEELYEEMSEEEKEETTMEDFDVLGNWLGASDDNSLVRCD